MCFDAGPPKEPPNQSDIEADTSYKSANPLIEHLEFVNIYGLEVELSIYSRPKFLNDF